MSGRFNMSATCRESMMAPELSKDVAGTHDGHPKQN
jgi:hypothetical protein